MAAQHAARGQEKASGNSVALDRLAAVCGASRVEPAGDQVRSGQHRRRRGAVEIDCREGDARCDLPRGRPERIGPEEAEQRREREAAEIASAPARRRHRARFGRHIAKLPERSLALPATP